MSSYSHVPVLLNEVIDSLKINKDGIYVDATLGNAGHSGSILEKLKRGRLYAFDKDSEVIDNARAKLSLISNNFEIIDKDFKDMKEELAKRDVYSVDGILFDLGTSSMQLDDPDRGFNYHKDANLDLRMDRRSDFSALDIVNKYSEADIARILKDNADEKYAKSIAKSIVASRPINTTLDLVEAIKKAVPYSYKRKANPARKTFQAFRIEVNDEFNSLAKALTSAVTLLKVGARLVVITFHSKEEQIVSRYFKRITKEDPIIKGLPNIDNKYLPKYKIIKQNYKPSIEEIENNPRSRSARLYVLERVLA